MSVVFLLSHLDGLLHVLLSLAEAVGFQMQLGAIQIAVGRLRELCDKVVDHRGKGGRVGSRAAHVECQQRLILLFGQCLLDSGGTQCLVVEAQSGDGQTVGKERAHRIALLVACRCCGLHDAHRLALFVE